MGLRAGPWFLLSLFSSLTLTPACKASDPEKPCPYHGIGVQAPGGVPCSTVGMGREPQSIDPMFPPPENPEREACLDQYDNWSDYRCERPQICPDQGYGVTEAVPGSTTRQSFILINCSTGEQRLVIDSVQITGDSRCYYHFDLAQDLERTVLEPGGSTFLTVRYKPEALGEDHAQIRIHSNAQNFPTLIIPICARASDPPPEYPPGSYPVPDGGTQLLECKNVGDTVMSCHRNRN